MELRGRPSVTSWGIGPQRARPCTCDWRLGTCAKWPSRSPVGGTPERRGSDDRSIGVHPDIFVSLGARLCSVCGSEAGFGTPFRSSSAHAAIPGPVPLRSKRKVPGPECCRVSVVAPHPRTRCFGGSPGSHAGGLQLLLVSPPDRTAVLCSGTQLISAVSSTAQAVHFLRGRSGNATPRGFRLEAESFITSAPRGDSACDCPVVHHWNAARGTAEPDAR